MTDIRIPQFCCATCKHWQRSNAGIGTCFVNLQPTARLEAFTLDLALCTAWEKAENAEEIMYGKR